MSTVQLFFRVYAEPATKTAPPFQNCSWTVCSSSPEVRHDRRRCRHEPALSSRGGEFRHLKERKENER